MRPLIVLTILLSACATGQDNQLEADSANAANAIKARIAAQKAAVAAAEKAANDSAARVNASKADSVRRAQGIPSDAELLAVVHRLPPDSIGSLPAPVRATLNGRRCVVPQPYWGDSTHNAVAGAFSAKGAKEWAVVCSVSDASKILIMTAATGALVDSIAAGGDLNWIQGVGDGKWGYSLRISAIRSDQIGSTDFYGDSIDLPKPVDHDAIDVAFLEKASTAYYRAGGIWHQILTSD